MRCNTCSEISLIEDIRTSQVISEISLSWTGPGLQNNTPKRIFLLKVMLLKF